MNLAKTLPSLGLLSIIVDAINVKLGILIGEHSSVLQRSFKTKGVLGVIHHGLEVSLVSPRKNLFVGLRLLDTLKVASKEIFRSRFILNGEALY